jgi:hypothetical protein
MDGRDHRIYEEAAALWQALYHEPPPPMTDASQMLHIITRNLCESPYERLRSPFLRPSTIAGPAQPTDDSQLG